MRSFKRLNAAMLLFAMLAIVACASQAKNLVASRSSFNDALTMYSVELKAQDAATQAEWHDKFDGLIKAAQAALDGWQKFVLGETTTSNDYAEFMAIKNKLIAAGWDYFGEDK